MKRQFDYKECLDYSEEKPEEADTIIRRLLKNTKTIELTTREENKAGIDRYAVQANGQKIGIDLKKRKRGVSELWGAEPDVALEIWSVVPGSCATCPNGQIGWTLDDSKKTDFTLHIFHPDDTSKAYLLPFSLLREAFKRHKDEWCFRYPHPKQNTTTRSGREWDSECVFVPISVVKKAISDETEIDLAIEEREIQSRAQERGLTVRDYTHGQASLIGG